MSTPHINHRAIAFLLARAKEEGRSQDVICKLEWILHFLQNGSSLQETSDHFGITVSTLRRWIKRFNPSDLSSLEEKSRTPHNVRSSAVPPEVTLWIRGYREHSPLIGKERIAKLLAEEHGVTLSPSSIARVIEREKFYFASTPLHLRKRYGTAPVQKNTVPEASDAVPQNEQAAQECECWACRMARRDWSLIKRRTFRALLFANIAWFLLLGTTLWEEHKRSAVLSAELHSAAVEQQAHVSEIEPSSSSSSSVTP